MLALIHPGFLLPPKEREELSLADAILRIVFILFLVALALVWPGCSVDGELQQGYVQGQPIYQWECFHTDVVANCTAVSEPECETQPGCRWGYIERATPTVNGRTSCLGIHRQELADKSKEG
jgi:hypothetical protein